MYTRCKGCHTVHPVNASLLARADGKFRCGKCKKTGNALEALFDEWPEAGEKPPETGPIPDLGLAIDLGKMLVTRNALQNAADAAALAAAWEVPNSAKSAARAVEYVALNDNGVPGILEQLIQCWIYYRHAEFLQIFHEVKSVS